MLMRLHHVLCKRLGKAVILADKAKDLKEAQVSYLVYYFMYTKIESYFETLGSESKLE